MMGAAKEGAAGVDGEEEGRADPSCFARAEAFLAAFAAFFAALPRFLLKNVHAFLCRRGT